MDEKDFDEDEYLNMWLDPEEVELLKTKEDRVVVKSKSEKSVKKLKHEAKIANKKLDREICDKLDDSGIMARPKDIKGTCGHDKFRDLFPNINPNSSKFEFLQKSYKYVENYIHKELYDTNRDLDIHDLHRDVFNYKYRLIQKRTPITIENLIGISSGVYKLLISIFSKRLEFISTFDIPFSPRINLVIFCQSWSRLKDEFREFNIFLPDINVKYVKRHRITDNRTLCNVKIRLIEFVSLLNKLFDDTYFTTSYIVELLELLLNDINADPREELCTSIFGTRFPKYVYKFAISPDDVMLYPNQMIMEYLMSKNVRFLIPNDRKLSLSSHIDIFRTEKYLSKLVKVKRNSDIIDGYYMFKNLTFEDGYMNKFFRVLPPEVRYIIFGYLIHDVVCLKNPIRV